MSDSVVFDVHPRVLHAIIGHKLPVYFINAINSVLAMTEDDDVIAVDNASNLPELMQELQSMAAKEPRLHLMLRDSNDMSRNIKVGGLYDAYNEVVSYALQRGYDYLHIMQNDMQLIWWEKSVIQRAREIYAEYPECVNICMFAQPRYSLFLSGNVEYVKPNLAYLRDYGLTDTGLYDLNRWRRLDMRFLHSEKAHSQKYLNEGLRVFFHPLPAVALIPWPAVVRSGRIIGQEIRSTRQFLLRPLSSSEVIQVKESIELIPLEDLAVPWGWTCLSPYWSTDLMTINYWVYLYRDIRARGLRAAWPRLDRRGLPRGASLRQVQRRPRYGLLSAVVQPIWYSLRRRLTPQPPAA